MSITLTGGIDTWFIDEFKNNLYQVCQQKQSKLEKAVIVEPVNAEDKAFDMMGTFSLVDKTGRNPQTPVLDPTTQRRWVKPEPAHNAVVYDKDDDLSMLLNPVGDFVTAFRYAVNRKKDAVIYAAFDATVQAGRKYGDSTIAWTNTKYTRTGNGRVIEHDTSVGNAAGASVGLTKEKVELALERLGRNDVDEDIPLFGLVNPIQVTDLRGQQEFISFDYNDRKPLARGGPVGYWMGINWIQYSGVAIGSSNDADADTNVYPVWIWAKDAIKLGVADGVSVTINVRPDLSNGQQVYVHIKIGACRMDEDKVVKIECV